MAFHPQPSYVPHPDFDPAYPIPTYPAQPFPPHHQQPPYHQPSYHPQPVLFGQQPPHQLPDAHAQQSHHARHHQQHRLPNHAHGHGPPPGSMPPPSSIPDAAFHRQTHAYASSAPRTPDRWPLGVTDDHRHLQEQYRQQCKQSDQGNEPLQAPQLTLIPNLPAQTPQTHPNYNSQPSSIPTPPPSGPVSSFLTPLPQNRTPPQTQAPPQSPQTVESPPSVTQQPRQPMTATTTRPHPQSTPPFPTPAKEAANPSPSSIASVSIESQRVSALLDLNRVLLQEVVALQETQKENKASTPAAQTQQNPQQASPSPAIDSSATATPQSKPDTTSSSKQEGGTNNTSNPSTTDDASPAKPSQPQPLQQNKPPSSKEYIEYMRRLQANLAYLANVADRHHKPGNPVPQFPSIMEPPAIGNKDAAEVGEEDSKGGKESLKALYARLKELWPEYKGQGNTPGASAGTGTAVATTMTASAPAKTTTAAAP
ncbi:MAG: hypothetical protein L6R40_004886 [Gallowayella cf. fulva]|nr:MAG: hypothetical protein L6R40_004886 [Xanthomendoza cf. fulva]